MPAPKVTAPPAAVAAAAAVADTGCFWRTWLFAPLKTLPTRGGAAWALKAGGPNYKGTVGENLSEPAN